MCWATESTGKFNPSCAVAPNEKGLRYLDNNQSTPAFWRGERWSWFGRQALYICYFWSLASSAGCPNCCSLLWSTSDPGWRQGLPSVVVIGPHSAAVLLKSLLKLHPRRIGDKHPSVVLLSSWLDGRPHVDTWTTKRLLKESYILCTFIKWSIKS